MFARLHCRAGHYLLLMIIASSLFFPNLGGPSLWDLDEGKNLTCSWEMYTADNWVTPTFNGDLRPDKPALLYWLQIAAFRVFGVNEFAGRLPSALAALGTVLLCYELGRSMFTRATGLLAGLVVAATPMLCGAARFANPDALLNFFVVLTLTLFWLGRARPRLWWFAAIGAAEGFGMLAKGPVAVVLPSAIIVLYLLWERRLWLLLDRRHGMGVLAFVLVAVPWYLRVSVETKGEFAAGFFFTHNVGRALGTMENHYGGPWYYPLVMIVGTVPWSIFLGPALWFGFWSTLRQPWSRLQAPWSAACDGGPAAPLLPSNRAAQSVAAYRLLACWIGLWLLCFTVAATKLPNYALPVVVPTAIVIARFLERWRLGELAVPAWVLPTSMVCLALTGVGLGVGLLIAGGALPLEPLRGRSFAELRPWALVGLAPLLGGIAGAACLRTGRKTGMIFSVAAAGVLLLGALGAQGVFAVEGRKSPRALVDAAGALQPEHDIRIVAWQLEHLPSLNFYVRRNVKHCSKESELASYLDYPLPVFAFLPASEWERLRPMLGDRCREVGRRADLYKRQDVVVVANGAVPAR
jgi:4-amino-4-deoxy-L-arabinose transferase-like glycosyltransferase